MIAKAEEKGDIYRSSICFTKKLWVETIVKTGQGSETLAR